MISYIQRERRSICPSTFLLISPEYGGFLQTQHACGLWCALRQLHDDQQSRGNLHELPPRVPRDSQGCTHQRRHTSGENGLQVGDQVSATPRNYPRYNIIIRYARINKQIHVFLFIVYYTYKLKATQVGVTMLPNGSESGRRRKKKRSSRQLDSMESRQHPRH